MFSLKQYITENYLNEKLLSDILVHEILNDTGGFFKYYKMPYNGTYYQYVTKLYSKMSNILYNVFTWDLKIKLDIKYENESIDTQEKLMALYNVYMNMYNKYIKYMSKIFEKPDPKILASLVSNIQEYDLTFIRSNIDLYNITDEHFYKVSLSELKLNKELKDKLTKDIPNRLIFWFTADKKILVVSRKDLMILYAIDNNNITNIQGKRNDNRLNSEMLDDMVKPENLIDNEIKCTLEDGTELIWPKVTEDPHQKTDKLIRNPYMFIHDNLDLSKNSTHSYYSKVKFKLLNVGSFLSKASHIQKYTSWGTSPEDYVIVYLPEDIYKDNKYSSYYVNAVSQEANFPDDGLKGFNDFKSGKSYNVHNYNQAKDFDESNKRVYKWIKNILGKYEPYAKGKPAELFKYGYKLSEDDYNKLYGDDEFCNELVVANIGRYKTMIERNKSMIGITNFNENLKEILKNINHFNTYGKLICDEIKLVFSEDIEKFKSLMILYGTFMKLINQCIYEYSKILKCIYNLKEQHMKTKVFSTDKAKSIKKDKEEIDKSISKTLTICNELKEFETKIEELKNE